MNITWNHMLTPGIIHGPLYTIMRTTCQLLMFIYKNLASEHSHQKCYNVKNAVKDKFFTPHGFISLATHTTTKLSWILGKSFLKPKMAHIYTKMRQSLWFKLITHHLIFGSWPKLMSLIKRILGVMVWGAKKYVQ